jgi:hypothetical protein
LRHKIAPITLAIVLFASLYVAVEPGSALGASQTSAAPRARSASTHHVPLSTVLTGGLLTPQVSAERFDAVGVSWSSADAPASSAVWVRVREPGGWSEWNQLGPSDSGPDAGTAEAQSATRRTTTEPLLTSGADAVQVRIDAGHGALRDVRAELVDAGSAPAGTVTPAHGRSAHAASAVSAAPPMPPIITRAQWGADESLRGHAPEYAGNVKVGVIHHTASTNSYTDSAAQIRAIYVYETQTLGWSDIAYNALVDKYGNIFEGRFGGLDRAVISAATAAFNTSTFSISAIGNYSTATAPDAMVEAISQMLAWKLAVSYVDPMGSSTLTSAGFDGSPYPAGQKVTFQNIIGHRDTFNTNCPGDDLYRWMDHIRYRVKGLTLAGLAQPTLTTTPRTQNANGSVRITSGLLYGGSWAVRVFRPDGAVSASYSGTGQAIDVTWPMTDGLLVAPDGTYGVQITSTQNGTSALPFNAAVSTQGFVGHLDGVAASPGGTVAYGWAAASNGAPVTVALSVDGAAPVRVAANTDRPDVGAAHPDLGSAHGFLSVIPIAVGVHTVCATGEHSGLVSAPLGCRDFNNPRSEPIGNVEAVSAEFGGLQISGWTLDRDTGNSIKLRVYVDGRFGGDFTANGNRPDINTAYPAYGSAHGFSAAVNTGPGWHTVCVNGLNVGPGTREGFLRCVSATALAGRPMGSIDTASGTSTVTVTGWAFDPDTTAPIPVHIYVDGAFAGAFTADASRPDVGAAFPFMGSAHGYTATIGGRSGGSHTVCAYAINQPAPGVNPLLGCRTSS